MTFRPDWIDMMAILIIGLMVGFMIGFVTSGYVKCAEEDDGKEEVLKFPDEKYRVESFYVLEHGIVNVWSGGLLTCLEYVNKSHSFKYEGVEYEVILNPNDHPIKCEVLITEEMRK